MPDVISVEVQFGVDIPLKLIQVPIVRAMPEKKAFLGGYRSRKTAIEYHHASSQTDPAPRSAGADDAHQKFHRETQTAVLQTHSQQAVREAGTQMPRGHLKAEDSDTILRPLPYFDGGMVASLRLEKAIDLQRYTRGWFARTAAAALRRAQALAAAESMAEEEKQKYEAEQRHKLEIQRRMHPHSYEDFEILYNEVRRLLSLFTTRPHDGTWHMALPAPSCPVFLFHALLLFVYLPRSSRRGGCRRRARSMSTVWTRRSVWRRCSNYCSRSRSCYRRSTGCACRRTTRTATAIRSTLQLMSARSAAMSDGEICQVHTPFTTRAKELMELYNGLRLPLLTIDERLDVLLHVKWTVKEFDCNLTRDVVELIDREADMLNRGRSEASLQGLRKRLANLFLQFIETPEFNPEAARFQKVPPELTLRANVTPIPS